MSLFDRRVLLMLPLALAACGFTPVYAPGGTGQSLQNAVLVKAPSDRSEFLLVQRLEERLGRATAPRFDLAVTLSTQTDSLGIDSAGNADRLSIIGTATYSLTDSATAAPVAEGSVNSFTGYSASDSTVATLAAERDAQERLMIILADQIIARLLVLDLNG